MPEPATIWSEALPPDCPPENARPPQNETFYRMVRSYPPGPEDFYSHRRLHPERKFNASECIARAASLYRRAEDCLALLELPAHRGKQVVGLCLPPESGRIAKTGKHNISHFSWWRWRTFDPLPLCRRLEHSQTKQGGPGS